MNHTYRSIWNEALGAWIAVSELAQGQGKKSNRCAKILTLGLLVGSLPVFALPVGNQLIAGQANVSTPDATTMQIDQTSQRAAINWQGFSIGQQETVNIQQPNANAALLNRVVGQDASQIQGKLNANGQVYLVNPNGVIFSKTAQVDVGGLVATTHEISNADFMSNKNHFTQNGATGKVENHGTINAKDNGVVALIGESVTNTGTINTPKGTTALAAGKTVDLDFQGDGLVEVKVSEAALNAQINNQGAIQADGGRVLMNAKAANQLIDTVINQQGIVKAQSLVERNGEIVLDGGNNGTVNVTGILDSQGKQGGNITLTGNNIQLNNTAVIDASGQTQGGNIVIGDQQTSQQTTLAQGSTVNANATDNGNAGNINVFANMEHGQLTVQGKLNAKAQQGNGGFIETSAATVNVADSAKVSTQATQGNNGTWLIDPTDFTVAATGGDMTGAAVSNALAGGNFTIQSTSGKSGVNGDININDVISWTANTLTLYALNNIYVNTDLNGSGTAKLFLQYGQASTTGGFSDYFLNASKINLPAGGNFSTQKGSSGVVTNYTVITSLGNPGSMTGVDLQGINGSLAGNYVLGADIDATATSNWNTGSGFLPISTFTGNFNGLNHSINNLTINRPNGTSIGLFGATENATIRNVALLSANITGSIDVGGLVGNSTTSAISNSYVTGDVKSSGNNRAGGLVGNNGAGSLISSAYSTAKVYALNWSGGLVGLNDGTISNAYATGNVTGGNFVGGLVGENTGIINNTYSTGSVAGRINFTGGLLGRNANKATITNSFWDIQTSNQPTTGIGSNLGTVSNVYGKTTSELKLFDTFNSQGWNIANTGGIPAIWLIYEKNTMPLLSFSVKPLPLPVSITGSTPNIPNSNTPNSTDNAIIAVIKNGILFYITVPYSSSTGNLSSLLAPYVEQGYDIQYLIVPVASVDLATQAKWQSQLTPLQSSTKFSPVIRQDITKDNTKRLIAIENEGIKLPIKPHTIIMLPISCKTEIDHH